MVRQSGFKIKSFFIIILYFFISESLSVNVSAVLLLLIRLAVLIKFFRSGLCSKKR